MQAACQCETLLVACERDSYACPRSAVAQSSVVDKAMTCRKSTEALRSIVNTTIPGPVGGSDVPIRIYTPQCQVRLSQRSDVGLS